MPLAARAHAAPLRRRPRPVRLRRAAAAAARPLGPLQGRRARHGRFSCQLRERCPPDGAAQAAPRLPKSHGGVGVRREAGGARLPRGRVLSSSWRRVSRITSGVDFRAKNLESFDSLEKTSLDLYASVRSLYLQDRRKKIQNIDEITETLSDDDWEEVDSQ